MFQKLRVIFFTVLVGLLCVSQVHAQKQYKGLLWEISGNGIDAPSYLYGTMHVSNKIAFHLTDSFFIGLKSCDIVALETNPQKWLKDMKKTGLFSEYSPRNSVPGSGFYESIFELYIPENRDLGGMLSQDNDMINPLLTRLTRGSEDFSENTYLDMFLYQAGMKQGKKVVNLEGYRRSFMLGQKAIIPDKKEEKQEQIREYKLSEMRENGKNPYEMLQDAYRRGNLNGIDSINMLTSGKRYRMLFLTRRNIIMCDNLDSILQKKKTVFTGIGAAHLPGDSGVIELLRSKGYKVRSVKGKKTKKGQKMWDKIDEKMVEMPLDTTFIASDSLFKVKVPGLMVEMPGNDQQKDYLYSDMTNGAFYSVTRLNTYGFLQNTNEDHMEKRMDSLFFESIPGDIIDKEKIERFGFTGYDILNKTVRGDLQRYQIFITPLEIIVFKMGGTGKFVSKMPQGEEFFNSIQLLRKPSKKWKKVRSTKGGFSVKVPAFYERKGNVLYGAKVGDFHELIQAYDGDQHDYYLLAQKSLHDFYYIESDSFELRQILVEFAKEHKMKVKKTTYGETNDNHPFIKAHINNEEKGDLAFMAVLKGPQYYMLLAKNKDVNTENEFFNSFKTFLSKDEADYISYQDTALKFTVNTMKQQGDAFRPFSARRYSHQSNSYSKDKKFYEYKSIDHTFFNIETNEVIGLNFYKYHDYYTLDEEKKYIKRIKDNLIDDDFEGLELVTFKEDELNGHRRLYFDMRDTASTHRKVMGQVVWRGGVAYTMKTCYSSKYGLSDFQKKFMESFTPFTDTTIGPDIFKEKGNLFLEKINSPDSNIRENALSSLSSYVRFEEQHIPGVTKFVDTYEFDDDDKKYQPELIEELGSLPDASAQIIPYLEKKYKESSEERPDLQFASLQALADLDKKEAVAAFKKLILNDPPLTQGYEISNIFYRLDDSLELSVALYPALFELVEFDEYKNKVYQLLAIMVDSGIAKGSLYKAHLPKIIKEAKYAVKRQQSKDQTESKSSAYRSYYSSSYYQSNWSRSEVSYFCALLLPHKSNPEVNSVLKSMLKIEDERLLLRVMIQQLKEGIEPPKEALEKLWKEDRDLPILYDELLEIEREDLMNPERLSQELMAKGRLFDDGFEEDEDSIVFLEMKPFENHMGHKGQVYFYKSKEEDDEEWKLNYVAFLFKVPENPKEGAKVRSIKTRYIDAESNIEFNEKDKENLKKKMNEFIEYIKIIDHKRITNPNSSSYYNSYY